MSKRYTFSVIGGDRRQVIMIKKLLERGHRVKVFAINAPLNNISGAELFSSTEKTISGCDMLLLPLPVSRDGVNINLTSSSQPIQINDIIKACSKNQDIVIFGGLIPSEMIEAAENLNVDIIDYYKSEELQQKNALPSAEGAIMIAMENIDRVIEGMNVLISGYGRIGKILANKLNALGACVSVAARRDEVLCEIAMSGLTPVKITSVEDMVEATRSCEVIFNTVPKQIFTKQIIDKMENDPIYIEIASAPGGIDIPYARSNGMQIIFAPSLPGKYAPASAGEYIYETVKDILDKRGMNV